jgi:ribosomal protein S18 acetylase RimI-like enzyme
MLMLPNSDSRIRFIRAKTEDQAELSGWIQKYYHFDHIPFHPAQIAHSLNPLLRDDTYGVAYFAQVDQKTVGYFLLTYSFDIEYGGVHATLTDLYFGEEARRTGIGTAAMNFIESICREHNFTTLFLQVEVDNVEAQNFYKKVGFKAHSRLTMTKEIAP